MARNKNIIPSIVLTVRLPANVKLKMEAHLWSELENRVPNAAYQRFLVNLIENYFKYEIFDLSPFLGEPEGVFLLQGRKETVNKLRNLLETL